MVSYRNKGANVKYADLIYTPNDGREWLLTSGTLSPDTATFKLPAGITHYFINLIDENNFLTIYPPVDDATLKKEKLSLVDAALSAGCPAPTHGNPIPFTEVHRRRLAAVRPADQLATYDFESKALDQLHRAGAGSSITNTFSAAGTQSLEIKESAENDRRWMPLVSIPLPAKEPGVATGYRISFDAMLDEDRPGALSLSIRGTDSNKKQKNLATIVVAKDGIRVNTSLLAPSDPGSWKHVSLQWIPTESSDRTIQVTITTEHGDTWQQDVPLEYYFFKHATDIQIISFGDPDTKAYIDNVVVTSHIDLE